MAMGIENNRLSKGSETERTLSAGAIWLPSEIASEIAESFQFIRSLLAEALEMEDITPATRALLDSLLERHLVLGPRVALTVASLAATST